MKSLKQIKRAARAIATNAAGQNNLRSLAIVEGGQNPHLDGYRVSYTLPRSTEGVWIADAPLWITREEFALYSDANTDDWK